MTITTEFRLSSPSLPLVSIPQSLQPNTVECVHGLCLRQGTQMFIVQIDTDDDVSTDDLSALDEVLEVTTLGRASGKVVYKLTVELKESISQVCDPDRFEGAQMEPMTITPEGWHETKVFKNYNAFNEFQTACQNHGISLDLVSITSDPSTSDDPSPYGLTERQHEALNLALARGYYESPRQTSTEELAEKLGISQPSMAGLLRRAERQLLSSALGSQEYLNVLSR